MDETQDVQFYNQHYTVVNNFLTCYTIKHYIYIYITYSFTTRFSFFNTVPGVAFLFFGYLVVLLT